ncbi:MAG TPA: DinB family protein [Longimicrobiales bacterium]|nr:DinB family protein [Longimicrobiales bacterium]
MSAASMLADVQAVRSQLLSAWQRESATTLKVLRAYPPEHSELKPHATCKNARELAWMFTLEQMLVGAAVRNQLDLSAGMPPAPATMADVIAAFERSRTDLLDLLRDCPDEELTGSVPFLVGPKQMGDVPKLAFVQFILNDQIHHRGQFSVYLRMSGGKVPSIYGPSADEPWM